MTAEGSGKSVDVVVGGSEDGGETHPLKVTAQLSGAKTGARPTASWLTRSAACGLLQVMWRRRSGSSHGVMSKVPILLIMSASVHLGQKGLRACALVPSRLSSYPECPAKFPSASIFRLSHTDEDSTEPRGCEPREGLPSMVSFQRRLAWAASYPLTATMNVRELCEGQLRRTAAARGWATFFVSFGDDKREEGKASCRVTAAESGLTSHFFLCGCGDIERKC